MLYNKSAMQLEGWRLTFLLKYKTRFWSFLCPGVCSDNYELADGRRARWRDTLPRTVEFRSRQDCAIFDLCSWVFRAYCGGTIDRNWIRHHDFAVRNGIVGIAARRHWNPPSAKFCILRARTSRSETLAVLRPVYSTRIKLNWTSKPVTTRKS